MSYMYDSWSGCMTSERNSEHYPKKKRDRNLSWARGLSMLSTFETTPACTDVKIMYVDDLGKYR